MSDKPNGLNRDALADRAGALTPEGARALAEQATAAFAADSSRVAGDADGPACDHTAPTECGPVAVAAHGSAPPGYQILGVLGRGGMGLVYKARQTRAGRVVALKVVLGGALADAEQVRRFRAEAEAAAHLAHPGIVPIYEVGEHDGQPYFSMGYIAGPTLAARVTQGALPPREAAELVRQIADAIEYAHQRGIVHRDLKPGNILLDAAGRPHVTDFGLAKRVTGDSGMTVAGQILGTPSYMPPEQADGRIQDVGPASDVYALGAILYCLLVGRPPFQSASVVETLSQVVNQEPTAPSRLRAGTPRDLETICLKCLEKSPARRYPSAAALTDDLSRYLAGRPVTARPVGNLERLAKWIRREPRLAGLAACLLIVAATAFGIVSWQLGITRQARNDLQGALDARTKALGERTAALARETDAKTDAQQQTTLREQQLDRAETVLYANRTSRAQREIDQHDTGLAAQLLSQCDSGRRGWEWHYLRRECQRLRLVYDNHADCRRAMFSADGRRVLTCGSRDVQSMTVENRVKLWDAATGHESLDVPGYSACFLEQDKEVAVIAAGSAANRSMVRIYDSQTGGKLREADPDLGAGVLIHPGAGRTLVAVDAAGAVVKLDAATLVEKFRLTTFEGGLMVDGSLFTATPAAIGSADGRYLAVTGRACRVKLIDVEAGREVRAFPWHTDWITFSADGGQIELHATAQSNGQSRLLDPATGDERLLLSSGSTPTAPGMADRLSRAAFSPDGRFLAIGTGMPNGRSPGRGLGQMIVWDTQSGAVRWRFEHGANAISAIEFSPDGRLLAAGGDNGVIQVRDISTGEVRHVFRRQQTLGIAELVFSPNGLMLASIATQMAGTVFGSDGQVQLWDMREESPYQEVVALAPPPSPGAGVSTNSFAYGAEYDGGSPLWFGADSQTLFKIDKPPGAPRWTTHAARMDDPAAAVPAAARPATMAVEVTGRAVDPATRIIAPGRLIVRDPATGGDVLSIAEPPWTQGAVFNADRRLFVAWFQPELLSNVRDGRTIRGYTVKVWDARGKEQAHWTREDASVSSFAISPDGRWLAMPHYPAGDAGDIQVWDTATRAQRSLPGSTGLIPYNPMFSPDGRWLAVGGRNGSVHVWSTDDWSHRFEPVGHTGGARCLAFNHDGTRLATAGEDLVLRVWEMKWGQELVALRWPGTFPWALAFSPDGRWLAGLDDARRVFAWDAAPLPEPPYPTWPPSAEELTAQINAGRNDVEVWRLRGMAYQRRGELGHAADDLARVAELAPEDEKTLVELADAASQAGHWEQVQQACRSMFALKPNDAHWRLLAGEAAARLRQFDRAASDYAAGEALIGNNLEFKCAAAGLRLLAGDTAGYEAVRNQAREQAVQSGWIAPAHGNAPRNAYLLARMAGYHSVADADGTRVLEWARQGLADNPRGAWYLHALGMAQLRAGAAEDAIATLEQSIAADAAWCPGLNQLALAMAQRAAGRSDEADRLAAAALERTAWSLTAATDQPLYPQGWHLHDWVGLHLLRREVAAQVTDAGPSKGHP